MNLNPSTLDTNRLSLLAVKIGGIAFAAIIGLSIGSGFLQKSALIVTGVLALILWFYSYQSFLLLCVSALYLGGTNPSAPGGLRIFELMAVLAVARLALEQVVLRRRKLARGPNLDWYLILGFMAVIVWHAVTNRMGMKIFGSDVWGGRQYIGVFLGFALYVGFQTVHIDVKRWRWLPIAIVIPTFLDAVLTVFRSYAPQINTIIAHIYDIGEDPEMQYNPMMMGARLGALGAAGLMICLAVHSYRRVPSLFIPRPSTLAYLFGFALVLAGSFRSTVVSAALIFIAAAVRDLRGRALFPIGAIVAGVMFLAIAHGNVIHLPEQVQRALTFVPGNWDSQVMVNSNSSDDFRLETWANWRERYFPKAPWFGRGFGFNPNELAMWQFAISDRNIREALLVTQEVHSGFYSSLDCVGVVGTVFLIAWSLVLMWRIAKFLLDKDRSIDSPALRWLGFYLLSWTLLYWVGALKLSQFLAVQFVLTSLFVRLQQEISKSVAESPEKSATESKDLPGKWQPSGRPLLPPGVTLPAR